MAEEKKKVKLSVVRKPRAVAPREQKKADVPMRVGASPVSEGAKYVFAVGRRKEASASVRLFLNPSEGAGTITVNTFPLEKYFPMVLQQQQVRRPLEAVGKADAYLIAAHVNGGGITGQTEAVQLGIARALLLIESGWRTTLRSLGLVTRDPRVKERKKYGLKKARRGPQWSKR